jgi:hypothetical protein
MATSLLATATSDGKPMSRPLAPSRNPAPPAPSKEGQMITDEKAITHARFSQRCSYIAKNASAWAADCLTLPEEVNKPMRGHSVERFIEEMEKWISFMREDLEILRALKPQEPRNDDR